MTEPSRLLWLLVAYNNLPQVDRYIDQLRGLPGSERFDFAVCDNSPAPGRSRHAPEVLFVERPDNPGYLEGALVGLEAYVAAQGSPPGWCALSNTDLDLLSGNPLEVLDLHDAHQAVVLAPRITEGEEGTEKNPHVLERRSLRRLRLNAVMGSNLVTTLLYQVLAAARWRASGMTGRGRHDPAVWNAAHAAGARFYSPYGALMFFSGVFVAQDPLPRLAPLLTEEYFIAEAARALGAPIVFEPRIHAHHSAHVTTGPKVSVARARATSRAFRTIYRDARARRAGDAD